MAKKDNSYGFGKLTKFESKEWMKGYKAGLKGKALPHAAEAKTSGRVTGESVAKSVAKAKAGGETKRENKRTSVMRKADLNKKKK